MHTEVPLLDGAQEAFLHAEVPPLDTRPPGTHEVTVAELGEDTEHQLGRQGADGHFNLCVLLEGNFYVNLIINITYLIDKEAIAPHLYGH